MKRTIQRSLLVLLGLCTACIGPFPPYSLSNPLSKITTVAGTGQYGYSSDGTAAAEAKLSFPTDVAWSTKGELYIAASGVVQKVDSYGIMTTFAGNLAGRGYSDEVGPPTAHGLGDVSCVAVDQEDNVYFADSSSHCVRMVSATTGISRRIAGAYTGPSGPSYPGFGGDGGPAIEARLSYPSDLATDDQGNLYIADAGNYRVRKVDKNGVITTVAGSSPADEFPPRAGYGGDWGPATSARLGLPSSIAIDHHGNLYIADAGNYRVRKVDRNGIITTVAGRGPTPYAPIAFGYGGGYWGDGGLAVFAQLGTVKGIAVDDKGNLYISDTANRRVRKADSLGIITTLAGTGAKGNSGDGGPSILATFDHPTGLALDNAGNLFVADYGNHVVRKISF